MGLPDPRQLIFQTLTDPRAAARRVLSFGIGFYDSVRAAMVVSIAVTLMAVLGRSLLGPGRSDLATVVLAYPIPASLLHLGMVLALSALATAIGRFFGGTGRFDQALALMVWFQAVMLVLQAVQIILLLAMPPLAAFIGLLLLGWVPWGLANFITILHGFRSVLKVLIVGFISVFGLLFLIAFLLTVAGVRPPGAG